MALKTIIFWYNYPPVVTAELIVELARLNNNRVILVTFSDFTTTRKSIGWTKLSHPDLEVVDLSDKQNVGEHITELLNISDSHHVFNGFQSRSFKEVISSFKKRDNLKFDIILERPNFTAPAIRLKKVYFFIKYSLLFFQYRNSLSRVLAVGQSAVSFYQGCLFTKNKIAHYLYTPNQKNRPIKLKNYMNSQAVHFLYVGRIKYSTRGVDLLKEFPRLKGNWKLDIVGDYGEDYDNLYTTISAHDRIDFLGKWPMDKVVEQMQKYDVILAPSRYEGWNLNVNEAFHAGVPCICTPYSGSNHLVERGRFGYVVKRSEFIACCQSIINDPEKLEVLNDNLVNFRNQFSKANLSLYLEDLFSNASYRTKPEWL